MNHIEAVLNNLANAPKILQIVREIPAELRRRRPSPDKWSAHEHACHLAEIHPMFFERLNLMLTQETPTIKPHFPDVDDAPDVLLNTDLDEALEKFANERKILIEKLQKLSPEQWRRKANHEQYAQYSIFIMFRHLSLHDYLHIYRIEELLLKNDW